MCKANIVDVILSYKFLHSDICIDRKIMQFISYVHFFERTFILNNIYSNDLDERFHNIKFNKSWVEFTTEDFQAVRKMPK